MRPDGTYSGNLAVVPPTGETRAQILADYCASEGLKLEESIAYADSTSDLPMLEAVGFPVAVNPETRLAAIARKRGWLVEDWAKASGAPKMLLPLGTMLAERERRAQSFAVRGRHDEPPGLLAQAGPLRRGPAGRARSCPARGASVGPADARARRARCRCRRPTGCACAPRLAGICGSDLSMIDGTASAYFDPLVSFPFTPGHEVVADVSTDGSRPPRRAGARAVVRHPRHLARVPRLRGRPHQPVRAGRVRPPRARPAERLLHRHRRRLEPRDGGPPQPARRRARRPQRRGRRAHRADRLRRARRRPLHRQRDRHHRRRHRSACSRSPPSPPPATSDRNGSHRRHRPLRRAEAAGQGARRRRRVQHRRDAALGALATSSLVFGDQLTCGAPHVIDCVGSSDSLQQALQRRRPRRRGAGGRHAGNVSLELTSLWHREIAIRGCYAYTHADFDTAIDVVRHHDLGRLVSATYPLKDYTDAIAHAAAAGRRGAVKIAFDI